MRHAVLDVRNDCVVRDTVIPDSMTQVFSQPRKITCAGVRRINRSVLWGENCTVSSISHTQHLQDMSHVTKRLDCEKNPSACRSCVCLFAGRGKCGLAWWFWAFDGRFSNLSCSSLPSDAPLLPLAVQSSRPVLWSHSLLAVCLLFDQLVPCFTSVSCASPLLSCVVVAPVSPFSVGVVREGGWCFMGVDGHASFDAQEALNVGWLHGRMLDCVAGLVGCTRSWG